MTTGSRRPWTWSWRRWWSHCRRCPRQGCWWPLVARRAPAQSRLPATDCRQCIASAGRRRRCATIGTDAAANITLHCTTGLDRAWGDIILPAQHCDNPPGAWLSTVEMHRCQTSCVSARQPTGSDMHTGYHKVRSIRHGCLRLDGCPFDGCLTLTSREHQACFSTIDARRCQQTMGGHRLNQ